MNLGGKYIPSEEDQNEKLNDKGNNFNKPKMERKRIKCGHVLPTYAMRNTSRTTLVVKDTTYGNFLLTTIIGVIYCLMVSATMVHSGKTKILIKRWRIIYLKIKRIM